MRTALDFMSLLHVAKSLSEPVMRVMNMMNTDEKQLIIPDNGIFFW
jgi:hypothetical protein